MVLTVPIPRTALSASSRRPTSGASTRSPRLDRKTERKKPILLRSVPASWGFHPLGLSSHETHENGLMT